LGEQSQDDPRQESRDARSEMHINRQEEIMEDLRGRVLQAQELLEAGRKAIVELGFLKMNQDFPAGEQDGNIFDEGDLAVLEEKSEQDFRMDKARLESEYRGAVGAIVDLVLGEWPPMHDESIYQEMIFNVAQLREEKLDMGELRLMNTAFKELRYAMKVFKPYRLIPKAAVFGSARTAMDHSSFKFAESFGAKLARKGWMIITGGASGIMEAAMIGAGAEKSFGLNILLPFEQSANTIIQGNEKLIFFKYFFTRKLMFLKESQATVLFPGGFGTFDEGFESFTLVQTGKAKPRPLVLMDPPQSTFWKSTLKLMKANLEGEKLVSPQDFSLIRHIQDADQAVEELTRFYRNYDSSRFFKDKYLIRLRNPITDKVLQHINTHFSDILSKGYFERLQHAIDDDVKDSALHRVCFYFDKSSYSRLRQLIDYFNTL